MDPRELMAEAEVLRAKWQAALDEYELAKRQGRPALEVAKLFAAAEKLFAAYQAKQKAALDANAGRK